MTPRGLAQLIAFGVPFALLAGALGSEHIGDLYPCEMCHWQRWPHYAAVPLAVLATLLRDKNIGTLLLWLAALAIFISGAIGVFHAGVEYGFWEGITGCATMDAGSGDFMTDIMATPIISCDQPQWTLFGISLAGYNAIISISAAMVIGWLIRKANR